LANENMEHGNSAHTRTKLSTSRVRTNRSGDGSSERLRSSSICHHTKDNETSSSAIDFDRRRNAKEMYASLIRPLATKPETETAIKSNQGQQERGRYRSFFDDNLDYIVRSDPLSIELTPKKSNMKEETAGVDNACIYRWRSACSIEYESKQTRPNKDIATTATVQTTSISTEISGSQFSTIEPPQTMSGGLAIISPSSSTVSPSLSTASHPDTMIIETEVSNLTESPSSEGSDRVRKVSRFYEGIISPADQVLASITRLQELERKRSVVRDRRFDLEQRLHNFRRVALVPTTTSEEEEGNQGGSKTVVNWKYKTGKQKTILYTGRLNATGQPHDENALLRFGDDQVYKGGVRNGKRHGSGTNQWPDGQTYSGEWYYDSRNGRGTHIWKDGRNVTGTWKNGHLHGKVYFRWPNGAVFDGSACMGKKEGKGVTTRPNGTMYNGNYSNGREDGFGTLIRPDGVKYRGGFQNGRKEGYGVMLWHTQTYDGEWSGDRPHGQGKVVWSNGAVFRGQFKEGNYSGMGVYIWPSGKKFVGRWEKGVKHGHGVHTWPSGQTYDGEYYNGAKDGYGRMTWPDGSMYCGGFQRNRRCGRGIQTDAGGALVHCGLWKHDRPCEAPEDHGVLYVVRPQWRNAEADLHRPLAQPPTPAPRAGKAKEGNEEDGIGTHFKGLEDENLALPCLPSSTPAIVTPRAEEIRQSSSDADDFAVEEGVVDERIPPSSKDHRDTMYRRSPPAAITATFSERVFI
jgi:hypothetical protein